ncbi:MAG: hypothetical protein ACKN9T_04640 [Candidatus Methylumidiphilus sp.]
MALSSKALQQKRAKKAAKRKDHKKTGGAAARSAMAAAEWLQAAAAPIADVYVPEGLFDEGIGSVWFSRKLADGRYAVAVFLVDTFCLGVKNALYAFMEPDRYNVQLENFLHISEEQFAPVEPAYLRKLVEMAVAYADELGLPPHEDYKIAKLLFGDVDASESDAVFGFGKDGNPCYIPGPYDSPAAQRRVIKQLEKLQKDPFALLARGYND